MCVFQATYDPSQGYSPQPIEISHMALSRELQVWWHWSLDRPSYLLHTLLFDHVFFSSFNFSFAQSMAEQLAENYHNTWGRKKKMELQSKGQRSFCSGGKKREDIDYRITSHLSLLVKLMATLCVLTVCRRRRPPFACTLWHPDSKGEGTRQGKGSRASQISSTQWICSHQVKGKVIEVIKLKKQLNMYG